MIKAFKNTIAKLLRATISKKISHKDLPIIINNYNRVNTLKQLITALENRGYNNIHIVDNKSTYPPLLEFYKKTNHKVHLLNKNYGSKAFWKSGLWLKFTRGHYVITDSDVVPIDECPDDFLNYFLTLHKKYSKLHKVGLSLKIDDLPDTFKNKNDVYNWEKKYYENPIEPNVFKAPIDTTFALYKPFTKLGERDGSTLMFRVNQPYQARHLPWYIDNDNLDEEEVYYLNSLQKRTHWSRQNK